MTMMLEANLQVHVIQIEDICVSASKEYGLQLAMDDMEVEWKEEMMMMIFDDTKEYRIVVQQRRREDPNAAG